MCISELYSSNPGGRSSGPLNSFVCLSVCLSVGLSHPKSVALHSCRYCTRGRGPTEGPRLASARLLQPCSRLPPFVEKGASRCPERCQPSNLASASCERKIR